MGDIGGGVIDGSVSGWLDEDACWAFDTGGDSSIDGRVGCACRASKAVARTDNPSAGAVGGGDVSASRFVKKLDMSVCFP
jgi:hypothetical protein